MIPIYVYPNLLSSPLPRKRTIYACYCLDIFGRDLKIPKGLKFNHSADKSITGLLNAILAKVVYCKSRRPGKPRSMKNFVRHQSPPEPRDAPKGPVLSHTKNTKNSSCNQGTIHDMVGNSRIMKAILLHDGSMAPFDHSLSTSTGVSNYRSERSSQADCTARQSPISSTCCILQKSYEMKHYLEDLCQIFGNNAPVRLVYPGSREVLISQHRWHQQPEFVRHGQIQRTRSSIAGCHQPGCNKTFNRDSQPVHFLRLSASISLICRFNATANDTCLVKQILDVLCKISQAT